MTEPLVEDHADYAGTGANLNSEADRLAWSQEYERLKEERIADNKRLEPLFEAAKSDDELAALIKTLLDGNPTTMQMDLMLWKVAARGHGAAASSILDQAQGKLEFTGPVTNAAMANSTDVLQALVDHGWGVNDRLVTPLGGSAIQIAIYRDHIKTVRWLLDRGARPREGEGYWDYKTLGIAAMRASPAMISLLVSHGVEIPNTRALGLAAQTGRLENVACLIDLGAPIDEMADSTDSFLSWETDPDADLGTPLHWAAAAGHADIVSYLLEHKANVHVKDASGRTAWRREKDKGHKAVCKLLEGRPDGSPSQEQLSLLERTRRAIGLE